MNLRLSIGVSAFAGTTLMQETSLEPAAEGAFLSGENHFRYKFDKISAGQHSETYFCSFLAEDSTLDQGRFFVAAELSGYMDNWFVFMPSACYDGNRFNMVQIDHYPPRFLKDVFAEDPLRPEITMKEVPSLGNSFNRMITDASAPLVGIYMPDRKEAFFLVLPQDTELGNNGVELEVVENATLRILISLPCVRRKAFTACVNLDTAPALSTGTRAEMMFKVWRFEANGMEDFYRAFSEIRNLFPAQSPLQNRRSFSHAAQIIRDMFEQVRWLEQYKFFTKARGQERLDCGWVSYQELVPLFHDGTATLKKNVLEGLGNLFEHAPLPSGFFLSVAQGREGTVHWQAQNFPYAAESGASMTRVQAEILFYSIKLFTLLDQHQVEYPAAWQMAIRKLAEAFSQLWNRYRQFGFILNLADGSMFFGGSFSGALAPGALSLAADFFNEESFQKIAEESAHQFCAELHQRGFTYGGPGDALFTPDSESAFSLLDSLMILHVRSGDPDWLAEAEFCADYCSSWVPAVKYKFPPGSTFDQMDIDCRGAVQANLQNQHGAPAPCICSANSLLELYRQTGKIKYLQMLQEITHNCVQYLSTENHPIPTRNGKNLPPGDICEKVMFQDFARICGIIPYGSGGWTEIAVLLCITENPGIYCQPDKELLVVLDHVEASLENRKLTVKNIFDYPVKIRLLIDTEESLRQPLGILPFLKYETISLKPHEVLVKQW